MALQSAVVDSCGTSSNESDWNVHAELPDGCVLWDLRSHADDRGELREIFRTEWLPSAEPAQLNAVRSEPGVLRGLHAHVAHADVLHVVDGEMWVGLVDLRFDGSAAAVRLIAERPQTLHIPVGVAHAFYTPTPTTFVYALTEAWTPADELGCRWDDPEGEIPWRITDPVLSDRDRSAGSLQELRATFRAAS